MAVQTPPELDYLPEPPEDAPETTLDEAADHGRDPETLGQEAVQLAADLLKRAKEQQTPAEKQQAAKIAGMMKDPHGKTMTMALSDQAFRPQDPERIADQVKHLVDGYGVPNYFAWWERAALGTGSWMGQYTPDLVVPFIVAKLRQETRNVILPGEEEKFKKYLQKRRETGVRLNINQLGEAILGEGEARRRLDAYLELLQRPDVEYISVKISSIFSQINLVSFEHTVEEIKKRLRELYRQAMKYEYQFLSGRRVPKFINLDMEEYRDLHLTVAAFTEVLDEPEFQNYRAGIVLQAYLPDSWAVQKSLTEWAQQRVADGGAPIKLRIVKGANLAMEQVEAALHDWPQAPYTSKPQVDANFKRMVTYGCHPERVKAANLGIASHNLFDVAYGLLLREKQGVQQYVEFEMLEGMANHQARAVQNAADGLLLYAPVVKQEDFHSAISYLVRRLDENTAEQNFLHDLFGLKVGSEAWHKQKNLFLEALDNKDDAKAVPNRTQDRRSEQIAFDPDEPFHNEPDTDWSLRANQKWIAEIRDQWQDAVLDPIPLQINGREILTNRRTAGHDPARPGETVYEYTLATPDQIDEALQAAVDAQEKWASTPVRERKELLVNCAQNLARKRGRLMGAMMLDGGKRPPEADPEISEAIDFANYYARSLDIAAEELADYTFEPLGTVLVTPPWNFPLAIPCGGVLAGLMAGNTVLLKPAPEATLVGWELCNVLWEAGVPRDVLQFVPTTDDDVGRGLVTDERINGVILTGAYATGRMFQSWQPDMRLYAETSGKNCMIITAMADHDQAIKDLVTSAFGHNGQKCSAAGIAILEAEVYDNPTFMRQLRDAAASLAVGPQWDLSSMVTPVIREPGPELKRGLTELDPGEAWLLEPRKLGGNPNLWTPGIRKGVRPGSWYHRTECFGPVLGLMRAEDFDHAIEIANDSEFGLTSGLQSLDDREIREWKARIEVGNAYVNRTTTGAIVRRQPFGGWKKSVFGYAKAGGPNYVLSLGSWRPKTAVSPADKRKMARADYPRAWDDHFGCDHDPSQILGESNVFRYRPIESVAIRVTADDQLTDAALAALAADTCGVPPLISIDGRVSARPDLSAENLDHIDVIVESEAAVLSRIERGEVERLRVFGPVSAQLRLTANAYHTQIVDAPLAAHGRLELRHYLREQAVSHTTHRYGNIIEPPHEV